jgi:hypothetical protein
VTSSHALTTLVIIEYELFAIINMTEASAKPNNLTFEKHFPTFSVQELNEKTVFHINRFADAAFGAATHRFKALLRR